MGVTFNIFDWLGRKTEVTDIETLTRELCEQMAFKELALHIGVSYIANALSKCEFKTYEEGKEVKNKLYYMLNVSPNPNENSSQFINKIIENYYYKGHSLVVPHKDHLYCADSFHVDTSEPLKGYVFDSIAFGTQTMKKKQLAGDVFYFMLDNKEVKKLIDSMYAQYSEIMSMALSSYKKTNGEKYIYNLENYQAGDAKFKELYDKVLKDMLKSFAEGDNGVFIQYKGTKLEKQKGDNAKSTSDIVDMRKEIFEVVANALKIPMSMMNGNITNMNEIVKVFLSFCIDPLADMISEELTRKYYSYDEWKAGNFVQIDTSCINHVDILEVAQQIYNAIGSGAVNIDDIRNRLGWMPLLTEFSQQYFMSKNFVPADQMMQATVEKGGE